MPKLRSPVPAKIKLFHLTEPKNECLVLSRYPHSAGIIGLTGFKLFLDVGSLLCFESFLSGYPGLPSRQKPTFPNSKTNRNQVDEEPLSGCVTFKSLFYFSNFVNNLRQK